MFFFCCRRRHFFFFLVVFVQRCSFLLLLLLLLFSMFCIILVYSWWMGHFFLTGKCGGFFFFFFFSSYSGWRFFLFQKNSTSLKSKWCIPKGWHVGIATWRVWTSGSPLVGHDPIYRVTKSYRIIYIIKWHNFDLVLSDIQEIGSQTRKTYKGYNNIIITLFIHGKTCSILTDIVLPHVRVG